MPYKSRLEYDEDRSGIFICFVAGIAFALIPSSISSRVVQDRESGNKHLQTISQLSSKAYWGSFVVSDLQKSYFVCLLVSILLIAFSISGSGVIAMVLMVYPLAIIP